jgi:hypothetical protein
MSVSFVSAGPGSAPAISQKTVAFIEKICTKAAPVLMGKKRTAPVLFP